MAKEDAGLICPEIEACEFSEDTQNPEHSCCLLCPQKDYVFFQITIIKRINIRCKKFHRLCRKNKKLRLILSTFQ